MFGYVLIALAVLISKLIVRVFKRTERIYSVRLNLALLNQTHLFYIGVGLQTKMP